MLVIVPLYYQFKMNNKKFNHHKLNKGGTGEGNEQQDNDNSGGTRGFNHLRIPICRNGHNVYYGWIRDI